MPDLKDFIQTTPLILFFIITAWVYFKSLPAWKEVRLAEIEARKAEAGVRTAEASAIGKLTEVFEKTSQTTDELRIFLRAAMKQSESASQRLDQLELAVEHLRAGRSSA